MLGPERALQASNALLQTLRDRLRLADGSFKLPTPPALPIPADEDVLRARGEKGGRAMLAVEAGGDSFLRAVAPDLGADDLDSFCAAQRAAVVGTLALCSPSSLGDALAAMGGLSRDEWAANFRLSTTPFDGLALMLWSLLNERCVRVLGAEAASVSEFEACSAIECVTVGQHDGGRYVGFDEYRHFGVLSALPPPCTKRFREGSTEQPPARRQRREAEEGAVALPVAERDPAREALLAERGRLKQLLRENEAELRQGDTWFYLVRHPMEAFKRKEGYLEQLRRKQRKLIEVDDWVVVGFGRTEYALQAYSNGKGRLDGEFFSALVEQEVYAFRRKDVLVWHEDASGAAADLERLLKAVLAFTLRGHAPARELRDLLRGNKTVCAFSHPACCALKLGGWVDETLLMHPVLWKALEDMSGPHDLLNGGRQLTCEAQTLRDALLPATARERHAKLHAVWAHQTNPTQT